MPLLAGKTFIPIGLFARLPLAMLTVGALTLATAVTGSYAVGGVVAGAVGIGSALGAPVFGALADRLGQRPVLLFAAVFNTVAVIALILAAYLVPGGEDLAAAIPVLAAAFVAGASCPQVGSLARVRWMALTSRGRRDANPADLDTALSYESTADELTFVLGPALVGILASLVAPWLPLALAAALTITLVPAFAVHSTHHAVVRTPARTAAGAAHQKQLRASLTAGQRAGAFAAVALPVLAMVCMGTFFGSTQTALSSFSASFASVRAGGPALCGDGPELRSGGLVGGLLAPAVHGERPLAGLRGAYGGPRAAAVAALDGASHDSRAPGPGPAGGPADGHGLRDRRTRGPCGKTRHGHDRAGQRHRRRHRDRLVHRGTARPERWLLHRIPRARVRRGRAVPAGGGSRRRPPAEETPAPTS